MKFVFWQNVISIHQSAFIKALSEHHDVILVVAEKLTLNRSNDGWSIPNMGNVEIIVSPNEEQLSSIMAIPHSFHIFSGIDAFPLVYYAFRKAVGLGVPISVMAEPYKWDGIKGLLRRIKYTGLYFRYGKHINHLFTTGDMGLKCYMRVGFPQKKIHQWGYFTEQKESVQPVNENIDNASASIGLDELVPLKVDGLIGGNQPKVSKVKLIYVGRLDTNKNILALLKRWNEFGNRVECFTIVGNGPLLEKIESLAKEIPQINVLGKLNNQDATMLMGSHDYLILPSLYDGWGAVVNEALSQGTRVLCSDACGASILLDGKLRGEVFSQKDISSIISKWSRVGPVSQLDRVEIRKWALSHISGRVAANYFVEIISGGHPIAPWIAS